LVRSIAIALAKLDSDATTLATARRYYLNEMQPISAQEDGIKPEKG
jgi:hypothetical protein